MKFQLKGRIKVLSLLLYFLAFATSGYSQVPFTSNTLNERADFSSLMVERIDAFLTNETDRIRQIRNHLWYRDFSSYEAFNNSISPQRKLLAKQLGVVDKRVRPEMELLTKEKLQQFRMETDACIIRAVRWRVLEGLSSEGLLLQPKGQVLARIVMIPDADILPEVLAGLRKADVPGYGEARRLAEAGFEVLIPVLVSRDDTFSGSELVGRFTNQPHREWIYRQAYEVGRHVIGYELQKIFSAIDWFESQNLVERNNLLIGVVGYGEGGLLALNAAALDTRISSTLVSGYFNAREQVWGEPIYRNVFGLLKYFGDAELAVMAWPRVLVVEHSKTPEVAGPPVASKQRSGAAPGSLATPDFPRAKAEWHRARGLLGSGGTNLSWYANGDSAFEVPFSPVALSAFAKGLNINLPEKFSAPLHPLKALDWVDASKRQERTVREMEQHVQRVLNLSERTRNINFWELLKSDTAREQSVKSALREQFWNQIGQLPTPSIPANPQARLLQKTAKWTSYEVMLDVFPGVFAYGILLIPNDLKPGEKRPVVVCQHGLEGVATDVVTTDPKEENFHYYNGFAASLADRGYITFAPQNPYRGGDKFRVLQRKANPLGLSLFSIITSQHQRIVEWLGQLSFVDSARIGFYGLSYGGKTAMRVPALVEGYALSICSADFNEWVRKCASTDDKFSYMYTNEYEIFEWDLGHTFNHAEMAAMIAPRPFMVERGHYDNVAVDEWVGYEFSKIRRHYNLLGLPESARIEYFVGPHTIHGIGTFEFLDQFLFKNQLNDMNENK